MIKTGHVAASKMNMQAMPRATLGMSASFVPSNAPKMNAISR